MDPRRRYTTHISYTTLAGEARNDKRWKNRILPPPPFSLSLFTLCLSVCVSACRRESADVCCDVKMFSYTLILMLYIFPFLYSLHSYCLRWIFFIIYHDDITMLPKCTINKKKIYKYWIPTKDSGISIIALDVYIF